MSKRRKEERNSDTE